MARASCMMNRPGEVSPVVFLFTQREVDQAKSICDATRVGYVSGVPKMYAHRAQYIGVVWMPSEHQATLLAAAINGGDTA